MIDQNLRFVHLTSVICHLSSVFWNRLREMGMEGNLERAAFKRQQDLSTDKNLLDFLSQLIHVKWFLDESVASAAQDLGRLTVDTVPA